MLSTLLPGIRELRAPLAAGYIWLLAGWIALEPHIPEAGSSTGLIASIYRLNDALSGFGLAVAASFAAYLIGSLSITLFSPAIRQWFIGVPLSAPSLGPLAPLSEQGTSALSTLVRRTSDQMAVSLALTELTPDEVLQLEGISSDDRQSAPLGTAIRRPPSSRARRLVAPIIDRVYKRRRRRFTRIEIGSTVISFDPTSDLDQRQLQLVRRVVSEFDQIISTRLLGRDPDLFSAIDRHRAEVEFRLAVIPPLIVLSLAVATRVDLWAAPFVVVAGALAAFGLFVDAGERERKANDTLAGALVDARVTSPTLQALEQRTSMITKERRTEKMQKAAVDAVRAIGELVDLLDQIDSSPTRASMLEAKLADVAERTASVERDFGDDVVAARDRVITAIRQASRAWNNAFKPQESREPQPDEEEVGRGPSPMLTTSDPSLMTPEELMGEARQHANEARNRYGAFRQAAANALERATAEPMSNGQASTTADAESEGTRGARDAK